MRHPSFPRKPEEAALATISDGVRASVVRLHRRYTEKAITASFRVSSLSRGKGCFAYVAMGSTAGRRA